MKVKFVNWDRSYKNLKPEIDFAIQRVLSSGNLILREGVEEFEENLARFVGTKYAVALNSGTDAIYLALKALGIGRRKKVILPSHTFKSTCGAVINSGATPYLFDIGEELIPFLFDGDTSPDARIIVHISGEASSIPKREIVIEDACQALGAIKNPTTNAQCWSFYPAKILGAFGDAGAVTTNDEKVVEYIREARNHFKGDNRDFGVNSRMDNLQAAILNVKFKYLPSYIQRRKEVAEMYYGGLKDLPIELPNNTKNRVWQDFIIGVPAHSSKLPPLRDGLYECLKRDGIETMKNEYPWTSEYPKLPLAAKYEAKTLRLPCNPELTSDEIEYIIKNVRSFYEDM